MILRRMGSAPPTAFAFATRWIQAGSIPLAAQPRRMLSGSVGQLLIPSAQLTGSVPPTAQPRRMLTGSVGQLLIPSAQLTGSVPPSLATTPVRFSHSLSDPPTPQPPLALSAHPLAPPRNDPPPPFSDSHPDPSQSLPVPVTQPVYTSPPFHTHKFFLALEKSFPSPTARSLMRATRALLVNRTGRVRAEALGIKDLENVRLDFIHPSWC
jgi:hypothetical protein